MRCVAKHDPRFWAGLSAIEHVEITKHVPSLRHGWYPGEVISSGNHELMALAREHLTFTHPSFEWVTITELRDRLFNGPPYAFTLQARYLLRMVAVGRLEVYGVIPWPEPPAMHLKVNDYVFAVFDWDYVLAADAVQRLGGKDAGRRPDVIV